MLALKTWEQGVVFGQGSMKELRFAFRSGLVWHPASADTSCIGTIFRLGYRRRLRDGLASRCGKMAAPASAPAPDRWCILRRGCGRRWARDKLDLVALAAETGSMARSLPDHGGGDLVPTFVDLGPALELWRRDRRMVMQRLGQTKRAKRCTGEHRTANALQPEFFGYVAGGAFHSRRSSRQSLYCSALSGSGSISSRNQKRNQSRLRR